MKRLSPPKTDKEPMHPVEIEVKFYLPNMDHMRRRIQRLGAVPGASGFEKNIRFENKTNPLQPRQALLRLRQSDKVTLTYKSRVPGRQAQFKIHTELEVTVNAFDTMRQILESIGFHAEQVYEKKRESFLLADTHLCLDEMPYGGFIEIEGGKKDIRQTAKRLGLDWKNRILSNYLEIFEVLKQHLNLGFSNVTFDNFKPIQMDFSNYLHLFTAE